MLLPLGDKKQRIQNVIFRGRESTVKRQGCAEEAGQLGDGWEEQVDEKADDFSRFDTAIRSKHEMEPTEGRRLKSDQN